MEVLVQDFAGIGDRRSKQKLFARLCGCEKMHLDGVFHLLRDAQCECAFSRGNRRNCAVRVRAQRVAADKRLRAPQQRVAVHAEADRVPLYAVDRIHFPRIAADRFRRLRIRIIDLHMVDGIASA